VSRNVWEAFASVLGQANVVLEEQELSSAATATYATEAGVLAILRPANRTEVQRCVELAGEYGVALYPVSGGKNWGYGSRVPTHTSAILDLGRMKAISHSRSLAYVTVEPGVTQRDLQDYLAKHRLNLWMDSTGASPDCSIIGNTAERGFGHTPYADHYANSAGLEVVLPDGRCIETGFGHYTGAHATHVYKYGVGPTLDGLFSQSNFGIITRMTLWLMPEPEYFTAFFFKCEHEEQLETVMEALRPLRMARVLDSACHIVNGYKVISGLQQYPWERTGGRTPLTPAELAAIGKEKNFGPWNGSGALYGTRAQVAESKRLLRRALRGNAKNLTFIDDRLLGLLRRFAGPLRHVVGWDLRGTLDLLLPVYNLLKGIPSDHSLKSAYWRKRTPPPAQMNPDRDRCGLIWCAPVAPLTGEHARGMVRIATETMLRPEYSFEPALSLTLTSGRALTCVISIGYDRDVAGEDERALACYRELARKLRESGYYFYRLGIHSMEEAPGDPTYDGLLAGLKNLLDPNGILAPGRYIERKVTLPRP
jgi:4-cresol dehydrogenase (hydroxylating) flavoprotein subunit